MPYYDISRLGRAGGPGDGLVGPERRRRPARALQELVLSSFQTTLIPSPERLHEHNSVTKQH